MGEVTSVPSRAHSREVMLKHLCVVVRPGSLHVEEDTHELGWDVERLAGVLQGIGVRLRDRRVEPCDCSVCRE